VFPTLCGSVFYNVHPAKYKFNIGDHMQIRISKIKRMFEKGWVPNFSKHTFIVSEMFPRHPPIYDYDSEELKGTFYDKEIQKVIKHDDV
jgi:hypothetical protein